MFSKRSVNHEIIRLHERGLKALLNDETATLRKCYQKVKTLLLMLKNNQKLMTEFFKHLYCLSDPIMKEVFPKRVPIYNLRCC